jgi:glycosyltransferase involved in cell wall biosynthesis
MSHISNNVSICICTYNQAQYLEKAIRSASQQTILPIEIIVYDDCSTDETPQILQRLLAELPLLKIFRQDKNCGIAKNVDDCLREAKGNLIVRLDSDDYLLPDYTEKLSKLLLKHPSAGYAHADVQEINENGVYLNKRSLFRKSEFQSDTDALKASIKGYRVAANIIMFRKEALEKVNYLTGRPNFGEDYHLTCAISAAGYGNVYLNKILAFYRVWSDPEMLRTRRKLSEINGICKVFDDVIEPAYIERSWDLKILKRKRADLACQHANCLSWNIYSKDEKKEIALELVKLSNSLKVKIVSRMYLNDFGVFIFILTNLKSNIKSMIKAALLNL